jgi:catechol 2,3-dioxygenase-like lactoylglutathione lyase family enzyme
MFDHVSIGVRDLARAKNFYEAPTMVRLASARTMARTTTQPSWSTPTGIASRPIAAVGVPWRHTSVTAHASVPHACVASIGSAGGLPA